MHASHQGMEPTGTFLALNNTWHQCTTLFACFYVFWAGTVPPSSQIDNL